jgi:hypothetical protein
MELLKFIFSDFWIWLGAVILIGVTLNGLAEIVQALRKRN